MQKLHCTQVDKIVAPKCDKGEIDSEKILEEGDEEKERVKAVDFLLKFLPFMFCLFPQFSCLFRPRKNLVLTVFSSLKMISENKRLTKLGSD